MARPVNELAVTRAPTTLWQRLGRQLNYCWRVLATGWCFFSFSLGGLLLTLTVFPITHLCWRDPDQRRDRAQRAIHQSFRFFIGQMIWLGVMSVELRNAERLRELNGVLVLANHPTLIDVVLMISLMPRADCIVKEALWQHRYLGGVVRAAQYIPNRGAEQLVQDCGKALAKQRPLIVFPEGTRTVPGDPFSFQRGAAHVALATDCEMVPVILTCNPPTLTKATRWYQVPARRFHVRLDVLEPIRAEQIIARGTEAPLASRQLTRWLQQFFSDAVAKRDGEASAVE
ncbi:1-acyl-sn-glycerol-3-phosphate acyltransferase [Permianibacter sp. IMCC34836]|uniref:lysophospholipid acyltransferase family protein n=1 Tax=Permianibacter fluminis TaxID=2738515 RepID=UPI001556102F|nr:lysophospholipid acyltransferase family protein [Permianibacter fluminis]NQD35554.1 1-acyl-sn-glycerol-3-phosphate acyltransferase [Permianibacter fluminis]